MTLSEANRLKVKRIRTDRGKEYEGKFGMFLRREGIIHERSAPYTPEQNGVSERWNCTVIEGARPMHNEFNLPTCLGGESTVYKAETLNVLPSSGEKISRYEKMYCVKPSAEHFGCSDVT
jgi:transposase InsO family protein